MTQTTNKTVLAWHFTRANGTTKYLTTPEPLGVKQVFEGEVIPCKSGLHASVRAADGLKYAEGFLCRRVLCEGQIVPHKDDKLACSERTPLAQADAKQIVLEWAFWCANRAVKFHAVAALNQAGLTAEAEKLAALMDITDQECARRAANAANAAAYAAYAAADAAAYAAANAAYAATFAAARAARAAARAARAAYDANTAYAAAYAAANTAGAAYAAAYAAEYDFLNAELERRLFDAMKLNTQEN